MRRSPDFDTGHPPGHAARARRAALPLGAAMALAACTTAPFGSSVAQLGQLTDEATQAQTAGLAAVTAAEDERIRTGLAASGTTLRLDRDCAAALAQPDPAVAAPPCTLLGAAGPIEQAPRFDNIRALAQGLNDYAKSLLSLTADRTEDEQAFSQGVAAAAVSLSRLDASVQKATGAAPADHAAKLSAVAGLVADIGRGVFAFRRAQALRRTVLAADPIVQSATQDLFAADSAIDLFDRGNQFARLNQAQREQATIAAKGDRAALRAAQDRLFLLLGEYNSIPAATQRFIKIGQAHAALARAARAGAGPAELKQAALALFDLAKTINATTAAFKRPGETTDGN